MENMVCTKVKCLMLGDIKGRVVHVVVGTDKLKTKVFCIRDCCLICVEYESRTETVLIRELKNVVQTEFISTRNRIFLVTIKSIFIVDCDTLSLYNRKFSHEILQAGWSNTYDFLGVTFRNEQLQTYVFDTKNELIFHGEGYINKPTPKLESVGWGSSSTQFQGPTHDSSEVQSLVGDHVEPFFNEMPIFSWRGNCEEFVVSYIVNKTRIFKVFDHLCTPLAVSQLPRGSFYGPIAWKPEGNLIAAAIYDNRKSYIGLFEKNGLFRLRVNLTDIFYPITYLSWSMCGKVLKVIQEDNYGQSHMSLYMKANMRWYLKQHLNFSKENPLHSASWIKTSEHCAELAVLTQKAAIQYKFKFEFAHDHRHNIVACIDGKTLRLFGFSDTLDAPPNCSEVIMTNNPISMVAFHPSQDIAAVVDSTNTLYCYNVRESELILFKVANLTNSIFPLSVHHLFWKGPNLGMMVESASDKTSSLHEWDMKVGKLSKIQGHILTHSLPLEHIYALDNVTGDILVTYSEIGRTVYRPNELPMTALNHPSPLHVIPLKYGCKIYCIVLTSQQDLFIEDELVSKGITSILYFRGFLFVTDTNKLYSLKLTQNLVENLANDGLAEFHMKPLNETAKLVCMMGDTPYIVLYMPRGNFEVVACKPMEIRILEKMLSKSQWGEAIKFMRTARLNWNLLVDLDSDRFYRNLDKIVPECESENILSSIVNEISDKNCLSDVYKNAIDVIPYSPPNKRREVLDKLIEFLNISGEFENFVTATMAICIELKNIPGAMKYISSLLSSSDDQKKADQALGHLRIGMESEDLYKAALLTFDLKLADFVARKCQLDPQETDPYLRTLSQLDNISQRVSVHIKYQNWDEAVSYMMRKDDISVGQVLMFIEEHDVSKRAYSEAAKLKLPFLADIAVLYVRKLATEGYHSDAAILLVQHRNYDQAVEHFKLAVDHKKCLEYLCMTSYTDEEKTQLFIDLAERLIGLDKMHDAAFIYEEYLKDYDTAVNVLVSAALFSKAMRVAKKYSLIALIDIIILPAVLDSTKGLMGQLRTIDELFRSYCFRLKKLRFLKKHNRQLASARLRAIAALGDTCTPGATSVPDFDLTRLHISDSNDSIVGSHRLTIDSDVQSIVSLGSDMDQPFYANSEVESVISLRSHISSSSGGTVTTQRQMRKMEKMKQDTTEGSRYEEIALMRELHIMITQTFRMGPELRSLLLILLEYSYCPFVALQSDHTKLLNLVQYMMEEVNGIWHEDFEPNSIENSENYSTMDPQYRKIPQEVEKIGLSWVIEVLKP